MRHTLEVTWEVDLHDDFVPEYHALPTEVQDSLLAHIEPLKHFGPLLGRPHADTLNDSRHPNMKELRFDSADGVWRAFAFDPNRRAILLVAGDKSGGGEKRFYQQLIDKADARFSEHLAKIKKERK